MKLHDKAVFRFHVHDFNRDAGEILRRELFNMQGSDATMFKNFFQACDYAAKKYENFKISMFNNRRFRKEFKKDCKEMQDMLNELENHFKRGERT
ncbi:hypothetical protein ACFL23_02445 [Patescibacteria group bacterium]